MFICSCVVLSIFMTITLILVVKKKYNFVVEMLISTILAIIFTTLLIPIEGTVIDVNKIISNDNVTVIEKGGKLEITPAFTYYILVETRSGNHYIEEVDYEINVGDTYTSPWYDTFCK